MLATLAADGGVCVPVNGPHLSTARVWSNQTLHNFIRELQGNEYSAHMRGAVGGALYDSLPQKLQPPPGRVESQPNSHSTIV